MIDRLVIFGGTGELAGRYLLPAPAALRVAGVDHFLAMTTVQNLLGSRLSNRVPESIWNSAHIAEVEIVDALAPLTLTARIEPPALPAYGTLLLDVLRGDPALSIRADEAEEACRVLEPVLSGWARDLVPLEEYPAGSLGPPGIGRNR
ncbi:hypothetical protein ACIG56_11985 [Nocardia fusca]|uniref:hypothetical protein n=1 Tax=Nocardia fusca TaxID=941183 RepID=UPI0037CB8E42